VLRGGAHLHFQGAAVAANQPIRPCRRFDPKAEPDSARDGRYHHGLIRVIHARG